jgi:proton-coupled amino acid transporter
LDLYRDDPSITWWLMVANTAVSFSVLLTYPLQLFPALELMGPWLSSLSCRFCECCKSKNTVDVAEEADLVGFEPLPPLPEHDTASLGSHDYGADFDLDAEDNGDSDDNAENSGDEEEDDLSRTMVSSVTTMFPELTMPGDSPQLRLILVLLTYGVAVIVPNVQALISLAGAVAGSSTALLIPPVLELAWIRNLKKVSPPKEEETWWSDKFLFDKIKCWVLLAFGVVFMLIGSVASISDIISIYTS